MTQHYKINGIETKTQFKATYYNKKFKRIELVKGKLSTEMLNSLGRIIPLTEDKIEKYKSLYKGKVSYELDIKNKSTSLYSTFLNVWFDFYFHFQNGRKPMHNGAEGKALKAIIKYLVDNAEGNEQQALNSWELLLNNWQYLDNFHKKNTTLIYINAKLNIIIQNLSDNLEKTTAGSQIQRFKRANERANSFFKK